MAIAVIPALGQFFDNNGDPLNGGTVTVQDAGTTTSRNIYTDTGLSVAATNPIPLDSAGRPTQGMIYTAATAYKLILKNSAGTTIRTSDNIDPGVPIGAGALAISNGGTGATTAGAALSNLGGATAAELADLAADVAALAGAASSTEKTQIAAGTTAQRPASPAVGQIRYNSTLFQYEVWRVGSSSWEALITNEYAAPTSDIASEAAVITYIRPDRAKYGPWAAKAWAYVTYSGSTPTLVDGYNVASITDEGTGDISFTFTTALANANYAAIANAGAASDSLFCTIRGRGTGAVRVAVFNQNGAGADPTSVQVIVFGDL